MFETWRWSDPTNLPRLGMPGMWLPMPSYGEAVNQYQLTLIAQGNWDELPNLLGESRKARVRRKANEILDNFYLDSMELIPNLNESSLWRLNQAGAYNIAYTPDLRGKKVSMEPPGVRNLYLVSDTVREAKATSGFEGCASVALHCAERVLGVGID